MNRYELERILYPRQETVLLAAVLFLLATVATALYVDTEINYDQEDPFAEEDTYTYNAIGFPATVAERSATTCFTEMVGCPSVDWDFSFIAVIIDGIFWYIVAVTALFVRRGRYGRY